MFNPAMQQRAVLLSLDTGQPLSEAPSRDDYATWVAAMQLPPQVRAPGRRVQPGWLPRVGRGCAAARSLP